MAIGIRVVPERGHLAFGAITGNSAGTANTVLTLAKDATVIAVENWSDKPLMLTRAGVDWKIIPADQFRVFDLKANHVARAAATVLGVYQLDGAPTRGGFEVLSEPVRA
jgi:hypothetical protein